LPQQWKKSIVVPIQKRLRDWLINIVGAPYQPPTKFIKHS